MEIVKLPIIDWEKYRALRLRALKEDPQAFGSSYANNVNSPPEEWKRRLKKAQEGNSGSYLLFARAQDKLVGMIGAFMEKDATDTATIIAMYVPKEERGKGISKKLMHTLLVELAQKPHLKTAKLMVNKNQLPAFNLYKNFGFEEVGKEHFKMGDGNYAEELVMEKSLKPS
jgi:ribosomal protein S18 acetylase RimI-like enzyme